MTEIDFSNAIYRNEFQITIKVVPTDGLDEMNHPTSHARSRATVRTHSLTRTLLVALVVALVPLLVVAVASVPGVTVAFLAGAASGAVVAVVRRWPRRRGLRNRTVETALPDN